MARREQEIFDDLALLCRSPGFVHAIANFCFRDNFIGYDLELTAEDIEPMRSPSRLIRTEISTLIGLVVQEPVSYELISPETMQSYMTQTEELLLELHHSMSAVWFKGIEMAMHSGDKFSPFANGEALREPIFYAGESAYSFQYRELAGRKYAKDDAWMLENKGFSIHAATDVIRQTCRLQEEKISDIYNYQCLSQPENAVFLPGFSFTADEVSERSGIDIAVVLRVLLAFSIKIGETNAGFTALNEFNATNATPLLRRDANFILFQCYSLLEALYEAPFYWMGADKIYAPTALTHRGRFTEEFAHERLQIAFGSSCVHSNVEIIRSKSETIGEIDVLVLFGDRAIVLQAKSKRLTLEARKGNDLQLKDDFKKAIQNSYDQALDCSKALISGDCKLLDKHGNEIHIGTPRTIYPVCVIADHYPSLNFQARQFLNYHSTDNIAPPMVTDVFGLDAITEMLESPLRLLSYLELRAEFGEKLMATHELVILSDHLKRNLWVDSEHEFVMLDDAMASDLDAAMTVRREGLPGKRTPDGILTRIRATAVGRMIAQIEARLDPALTDLGLLLLRLSEQTVMDLSSAIDSATARSRVDRRNHDVTVGFEIGKKTTGITFHCIYDPVAIAALNLQEHCERKKYSMKSGKWFGVALSPANGLIEFCVMLEFPWEPSKRMDSLTRNLPNGHRVARLIPQGGDDGKVGRNVPCPCGSGRKFKKCCLK